MSRTVHLGAVLALVVCACSASVALAVGTSGPTPGARYSNGVKSGVGKTSVQIEVNRASTRVIGTIVCYESHGVQVQADIGPYSYPLRHRAFSTYRTYKVDKIIPEHGKQVEEAGYGKVLFSGRFTGGKFVGEVQIPFAAPRSDRFGGGCPKVSYMARRLS